MRATLWTPPVGLGGAVRCVLLNRSPASGDLLKESRERERERESMEEGEEEKLARRRKCAHFGTVPLTARAGNKN